MLYTNRKLRTKPLSVGSRHFGRQPKTSTRLLQDYLDFPQERICFDSEIPFQILNMSACDLCHTRKSL
ncbi:hypothetical protein VN97_g7165 [Penicillium thymicola]|uniref:Uncharacterized protein n=1 Tax=Penicillium thymicola TaxID=293382 RepID=A0AAI9X6S3_PENTH|nr:hypothetical protein VN97_g7165 [Penicillium thymicola]